jgi:membrane protein YdbS with pleckstrin-like domain
MRASPACQVSLQRFVAWRIAVCLLALAGAAAMVGWLIGRESPLSGGLMMLTAAAALAILALAVSLWRVPAQSLRWDGRAWQLDAVRGELIVAIDLGPWMLLRFTPGAGSRARWLPVQRRGLEAQWHALRCAVYAPRPAER